MKKKHNYLFTFKVSLPNGEYLEFNKNIRVKKKLKIYSDIEYIKEVIKKEYEGVSNVVVTFIHYLGR